jgi:SAM-dependent methyltransferase
LSAWRCWICGSDALTLVKAGDDRPLTSASFAITDSTYGATLPLYRCSNCSFLMCPDGANVLTFYEDLEDPEYEKGRAQRALQAKNILRFVQRFMPSGRLLDIGAGSGILVEEALKLGFEARGVEPSKWLQKQAESRGLPVRLGIFSRESDGAGYDVITLVDVIEHVPDPVGLLKQMSAALAPGGTAVIVTPDVNSVAARLLGKRWWHYRVAHIGYFDRSTLRRALQQCGLQEVAAKRPSWFFPLPYLAERTLKYLPSWLGGLLRFVPTWTVPLNLRDSWMIVARRDEEHRA